MLKSIRLNFTAEGHLRELNSAQVQMQKQRVKVRIFRVTRCDRIPFLK